MSKPTARELLNGYYHSLRAAVDKPRAEAHAFLCSGHFTPELADRVEKVLAEAGAEIDRNIPGRRVFAETILRLLNGEGA